MATKERETPPMEARDLEALWDERFPGCGPALDELCGANPYHWVTAEVDAAVDEAAGLERVMALADRAVWTGEPVVMLLWGAASRGVDATSSKSKARPWRAVPDGEGGVVSITFEVGTWRRSGGARFWKKLTRGEASALLVLSRARRVALRIGRDRMDAFVDTTSDRDALAAAWSEAVDRGS